MPSPECDMFIRRLTNFEREAARLYSLYLLFKRYKKEGYDNTRLIAVEFLTQIAILAATMNEK